MIFFLIALFCYVLMQLIETISFGSRVAGKLVNRLSLGTTLQRSIYTISRAFLPPLLLSLSFLIETQLNISTFLLISVVLTIAAFFASLFVFFRFNYFQLIFQHLFIQYRTHTIPIAILRVIFNKNYEFTKINTGSAPKISTLSLKKIITSCFAYFFLSTGFLVAFSIAILIPEYRMTLSHLTTAFHGIGSVVLAMFIDPMISRSLDVESKKSKWLINIYSIFVGRLIAYLLAASIFLSIYMFLV
jgi:hypothetical protein